MDNRDTTVRDDTATYGVLNWTLDDIDAWTREQANTADLLIGRRTVADLVTRIRELEAERAELARMEDRIIGWQDMDSGRSAYVQADREAWQWSWIWIGADEIGDEDIGTAPTHAAALRALYASLVAAGEIAP